MSRSKQGWPSILAMAVVATAMLMTNLGCNAGRQFREVASPAVQSGARDILNGLLDGFFAAIAPEPQTNAN